MRRICNFALCLVLCFSCTVSAFAASTVAIDGSTSQGTTISNVANYSAYNASGNVVDKAFAWLKEKTGNITSPGVIKDYGQYYLQYRTESFNRPNQIYVDRVNYPYYYSLLPTNLALFSATTTNTTLGDFTPVYPTSASVQFVNDQKFGDASSGSTNYTVHPYYVKTWTMPQPVSGRGVYCIQEFTLGDLGAAKYYSSIYTRSYLYYSPVRLDLGVILSRLRISGIMTFDFSRMSSLGLSAVTDTFSADGYYYWIAPVKTSSSSSVTVSSVSSSPQAAAYGESLGQYFWIVSDNDSIKSGGGIKIPDIKPNNGYGDMFTDGGLSPDTPAYLGNLPSVVEYDFKPGSGILIDSETGFTGQLQMGNYIYDLSTQTQKEYSSVDASGNTYAYTLKDGGSLIYEFTESYVREYYTDSSGVSDDHIFNYYVNNNIKDNYEHAQKNEASGVIGSLTNGISGTLSGVVDLITALVNSVVTGINRLLESLAETLRIMTDLPQTFASSLTDLFSVLPEPIANLITSAISIFAVIALISFLRG